MDTRRMWDGFVQERSLVLPVMALWTIAASMIALLVAKPTQAICWHGIGGALTDPHYWDAYCAGVQAEYETSLTLADRLLQLPWVWVILVALGWLAIAALVSVGFRLGAGPSSSADDPAATV